MKKLNTIKNSKVEIAVIPNCDICPTDFDTPAAYDGKTTSGPWAYMCEKHFKEIGVGLGLGLGQRLKLRTN